jgi:hypothetical protein
MTDRLSTLYQDLLSGSYDCVDRIVLNGYFRMAHNPGGFRVWWRALTGSDQTLENTYLMRLAGRFSRRVRGYAKAHGIPVIDCPAGQRKHDLAEEYLANTTVTQGLFLVLVGRAQAPVWDVNARHHIERKKPISGACPGEGRGQPPFLPYPRPRLGPSDDQDQRASAVPRPGDVETAMNTSPARRARRASALPRMGTALRLSLTPQAWRRSQTPCPSLGL